MPGEELLRETLATYAGRAPAAEGLAGAVRTRVARRRRVWLAVGTATAATVAGVTVAALAVAPDRERRPVASLSPSESPPVSTEPGVRVAFHGLEVTLPEGWPVNQNRCGQPTRDTVMVGPLIADTCFQMPDASLTVAYVQPIKSWEHVASGAHLEPAGGDARSERFTGTVTDGRRIDALVARDADAAVWVLSREAVVGPRVVASVRFVTESSAGCASRVSVLYGTRPPERDGATERMVPGTPTGASVCAYDVGSGWNIGGLRLDAADAARVAAMANALEPGFEPPDSRICDGNEPKPSIRRSHEESYVLTFRYAEGPDLVLYGHTEPCRDDGVTNGAVRGHWTVPLGTMVYKAVTEARVVFM